MKNITEKVLFSVFMRKIMNSFTYVVVLAKSMNHDIWKYEPRRGNMETLFMFLYQESPHGKLTLMNVPVLPGAVKKQMCVVTF